MDIPSPPLVDREKFCFSTGEDTFSILQLAIQIFRWRRVDEKESIKFIYFFPFCLSFFSLTFGYTRDISPYE